MANKTVIVIGGGIAGIEVSNQLSGLGYQVAIIEKSDKIGGKLLEWDRLFPNIPQSRRSSSTINSKKRISCPLRW